MIELNGITKVYKSGRLAVTALQPATLTVPAGDFVAIMGPSGSGKSTLMNIIGCLDRPTNGEYRLVGEAVSQMNDNALAYTRNRRIGFIFQNFNLLKRLTAAQNVELPLVYRGVGARERNRRSLVALESVGLADRVTHLPAELSGGQQQRVAIARAVVGEPAILLGDEPTGNLDSKSGLEIIALFQTLNEAGMTIVLVTHDEKVAAHCKRVVRLLDGSIISDETVAQPIDAREECRAFRQEEEATT